MRVDVEKVYGFLQEDDFSEPMLCEVSSLKRESFIIFDEQGTLINGSWNELVYPEQKPGVRTYNGINYAIYDTRYNQIATHEKKYSELVHELFHCLQIREHVCYANRKMVEGAALLVESLVYSRYIDQTVEDVLEQYGKNMPNENYIDYCLGAKYILKQMGAGFSWKDYFSMKI